MGAPEIKGQAFFFYSQFTFVRGRWYVWLRSNSEWTALEAGNKYLCSISRGWRPAASAVLEAVLSVTGLTSKHHGGPHSCCFQIWSLPNNDWTLLFQKHLSLFQS